MKIENIDIKINIMYKLPYSVVFSLGEIKKSPTLLLSKNNKL